MLKIDYFVMYCVVTVINILWTGGLHIATHMRLNDIISIHAPHTGSDLIFVHTL